MNIRTEGKFYMPDFIERMKAALKGKEIEFIRPENATKENLKFQAAAENMSDAYMRGVYEEAKQLGLPDISQDGLLSKKYLAEFENEFIKLKAYTNGVELSLEECVKKLSELGETGKFLMMMNPAVGIQEFFSTYNYWLLGKKDYYISPNLCQRLKASHIKAIPTELMRLPFRSFRMFVPDKVLRYSASATEEIYIREMTIVDYMEPSYKDIPPTRVIMVFHQTCDDIGHFSMDINQSEVHKCVDESVKKMWSNFELIRPMTKISRAFTPKQEEDMREMFEFVVKCILYITGANADIEYVDEAVNLGNQLSRASSGKKLAKLNRKLAKAKKGYLVGHKIVLSRTEKIMYANIKSGLWSLSYRFVVQGHWRNQAFGEGHQLRRLIFIEPFYKGPELADVVNNSHLIK